MIAAEVSSEKKADVNPLEEAIIEWKSSVPDGLQLPDYGPTSPGGCSASGLRGHIVNSHLSPYFLQREKLPLWDLQLAHLRDISLERVAPLATRLAGQDDASIRQRIGHSAELYGCDDLPQRISPADYRRRIAQFLRLLDLFQPGHVQWEWVEFYIPGAKNIPLDLNRDCNEKLSFEKYLPQPAE